MSKRGFTLIELVIVLTLLTILVAAVAPVYRESLKNARSDQAVRSLVATLHYAQERAVTDSVEYRVYLDAKQGRYWVARGTEHPDQRLRFAAAPEPYAGTRRLPEGLQMRRPDAPFDDDVNAHYAAFYPHGACDFVTIRLKSENGDRVTIRTEGAVGRFEVTRS